MRQLRMNGKDVSDELLAFARELVRTRSYSGEEEAAARLIAARMETLGYDEVRIDRFGSVVGRMGSGAKVILFDSHIDTVKVFDEAQWTVPPFSGAVVDGYLWGRGSVDMKAGAAAAIYAAAIAKSRGLLEGKTVYVTCTVFEEDCDGESLGRLLHDAGICPHHAVICEPSNNVITTGHKGKAQMTIHTRGVSAHGAAPEKGVNAVYEMAEIIQRVEQASLALLNTPGRRGSLVLSQISSTSVSLNAVPLACEIYLDRRLAPGETEETVAQEMARITAGKNAAWDIDTIRRTTWTGETLVYRPLHPAWEISLEHDLARAFCAAYEDALGRVPEAFDYWDFSTNAVAVIRMGVPAIGFGPGEYKLAHMRDERCAVAQILDACAVYAGVIGRI